MVDAAIIEAEADTLEEARQKISAQIPEGLQLLSEQVISDGSSRTKGAQGDTSENAFAKALGDMPGEAVILDKKVLSDAKQILVRQSVEAKDESSAKAIGEKRASEQSQNATLRSVRLLEAGRKGFLGIGATLHRYEVEFSESHPAAVEITYRTKAKIVARVGEPGTLSKGDNTIVQSSTASKGEEIMQEELITVDNVTKDMLKSLFDAAFMETTFDKDGDLVVKEKCKCMVLIDKEKRRVMLMTLFGFKSSAKENDKLVCVNEINRNYIIVRASANDGTLRFSYDISLDGGVSKKALVLLVKRFCSIPHAAVMDYGKEIVD